MFTRATNAPRWMKLLRQGQAAYRPMTICALRKPSMNSASSDHAFNCEYTMHPLLRSAPMMVLIAGTALASPVFAQSQSDLRARCDQLISYYDRYGASRSENSDGLRNSARIGAGIDCERGRYNEGITAMEALL